MAESIIALTRADGGVSIAVTRKEVTPELLARCIAAVDGYVSHRFISREAVPTDRTFRNAWRDNGVGVSVEMAAAREIHRDKLRQMRKPKLEAGDADLMKALEVQDWVSVARIREVKQVLRDVTADQAIAAATTPDALKAAVPSILTEATAASKS